MHSKTHSRGTERSGVSIWGSSRKGILCTLFAISLSLKLLQKKVKMLLLKIIKLNEAV